MSWTHLRQGVLISLPQGTPYPLGRHGEREVLGDRLGYGQALPLRNERAFPDLNSLWRRGDRE